MQLLSRCYQCGGQVKMSEEDAVGWQCLPHQDGRCLTLAGTEEELVELVFTC